MVLLSWHSHSESSPNSSDECQLLDQVILPSRPRVCLLVAAIHTQQHHLLLLGCQKLIVISPSMRVHSVLIYCAVHLQTGNTELMFITGGMQESTTEGSHDACYCEQR